VLGSEPRHAPGNLPAVLRHETDVVRSICPDVGNHVETDAIDSAKACKGGKTAVEAASLNDVARANQMTGTKHVLLRASAMGAILALRHLTGTSPRLSQPSSSGATLSGEAWHPGEKKPGFLCASISGHGTPIELLQKGLSIY